MARRKQEQAGAAKQEQAGQERIKVKKLEVKKETVQELSNQESKAVQGGAFKLRGDYSVAVCP